MTWIKPSATWMGYRSGWGVKDANQARILAIDLHRPAFDALLAESVLAKQQLGTSGVVVQWDPERGLGGQAGKDAYTHPLDYRSLQMGLRGPATARYAEESVSAITDVTDLFRDIGRCLEQGDKAGAAALLPAEELYPLPPDLAILPADDPPEAEAPPRQGKESKKKKRERKEQEKERDADAATE